MAGDINRVTLIGRLTRDPELRNTGSTSVLQIGLAVNGRKRVGEEWVDDPNFFDVKVWGQQADTLSRTLSKGRRVAVDGRLDWSSWEDKETHQRRSKVEVVANSVQYLDPPGSGGGGGGGGEFSGGGRAPGEGGAWSGQPTPVSGQDFEQRRPAPPDDDDIPF